MEGYNEEKYRKIKKVAIKVLSRAFKILLTRVLTT